MDNKDLSFGLRYADIIVTKFCQFELGTDFDINNKDLVEFNSTMVFKIFPKEKHIACAIEVKMFIKETQEQVAEIKVENYFDIKPFSVIEEEEEKFNLPRSVKRAIFSMSVSTIRGILHEKLRGTIFQNQIYPLVDFDVIIKSNKE